MNSTRNRYVYDIFFCLSHLHTFAFVISIESIAFETHNENRVSVAQQMRNESHLLVIFLLFKTKTIILIYYIILMYEYEWVFKNQIRALLDNEQLARCFASFWRGFCRFWLLLLFLFVDCCLLFCVIFNTHFLFRLFGFKLKEAKKKQFYWYFRAVRCGSRWTKERERGLLSLYFLCCAYLFAICSLFLKAKVGSSLAHEIALNREPTCTHF